MTKETIELLIQEGRHTDAAAAIETWLKENGPDDHMHSLYVKEKEAAVKFYKAATPFEYEPEMTGDPRSVLHHRLLQGEKVLIQLIQAHLMVPKDKTVVPEVVRLVTGLPVSLDGLYVLAVAMGDRADDYERGLRLGEKFLRVCPKNEKVYPQMEKMVAYWKSAKPDTGSMAYRLGHGDVEAMEQKAAECDDPWLKDMWLMHAAANGSQESFRTLAREALSRGQDELAVRLARNLKDRQEFLRPELEILVYKLHDYDAAEPLAWNLNSDDQSEWLRVIHYAQGKTKDIEGLEEQVARLPLMN